MADDEGEHTSLILLLESLRDGGKPCCPALPQEDGPSTHNRLGAELHQGGVVAGVHDGMDQVVLRTRPCVWHVCTIARSVSICCADGQIRL